MRYTPDFRELVSLDYSKVLSGLSHHIEYVLACGGGSQGETDALVHALVELRKSRLEILEQRRRATQAYQA